MNKIPKKVLMFLITSLLIFFSFNCPNHSKNTDITNPIRINTGRNYSIGTNTNGANDWNGDLPFADAMKTHRYWESLPDTSQRANLDSNGWPIEDARCLIWAGLTTGMNHGTYKLRFTGIADVHCSVGDGEILIQNLVYNAGTNITTADLIISESINTTLYLDFENTVGGVRNVTLMRPLFPGSTESHDINVVVSNYYLQKLAPFTTIRFMGWLCTSNDNPETTWSERTLWTYATQNVGIHNPDTNEDVGKTPSWESVIKIANVSGKDPWITIPNRVDDNYIRQVALLFRDGNAVCEPLRSDLKLYVEYSNEIWNWAQSQTQWAYDYASTYGHPLNFDGESDGFTLTMRFKAMRIVQISTIFREVFGDSQMMTRIRPVYEWQQAWNDCTNRALSFIDRYYNKRDSRSDWGVPHPVNYYIYGGGGSGYWYTDADSTVTSATVWTNGTWDVNAYKDILYNDAVWTKSYGLAYVAYEGDNHPVYSNFDEPILQDIHWDPRMGPTTLSHLRAFSSADGDIFNFLVLNNLSPCVWGVLNQLDPDNSPQYDLISQLSGTTAEPIDIGSVIPFNRPGNSYDTLGYENPNPTGTGYLNLTANDYQYNSSYAFRTDVTGTYHLQIEVSATTPSTLAIEYNGNLIGTYTVTDTSGTPVLTPSYEITCQADRLYAVRLVCITGAVRIHNVSGF